MLLPQPLFPLMRHIPFEHEKDIFSNNILLFNLIDIELISIKFIYASFVFLLKNTKIVLQDLTIILKLKRGFKNESIVFEIDAYLRTVSWHNTWWEGHDEISDSLIFYANLGHYPSNPKFIN